MKKKIVKIIILAMVMAVVFCGCGFPKKNIEKSENATETANIESDEKENIGASPLEVEESNEIQLEKDEVGVIR